jgi:hypothetical protein
VISNHDLKTGGGLIKEVPIIVKEIRPSVYSLSGDIPKTVYLMFKLRVKMLQEKIKRN